MSNEIRPLKIDNPNGIRHKYCVIDEWSSIDVAGRYIDIAGRCIIKNPGSVDNIKEVIFNDRATIILWAEGVKTIVKCSYNDLQNYSRLKGFLIGYYQYVCDYVYSVSKSEAMKYLYQIVDDKSAHIDNDMDEFIEKCIFNGLTTIVMWKRNKKTVCRCSSLDSYDKETGFLMCFFKYHCGLSNTKIHDFLFEILSDPIDIESKQVARLKERFNFMKKREPRAFNIRIEHFPTTYMYGREVWEVLIVFYDHNVEKKHFVIKHLEKGAFLRMTDEAFDCFINEFFIEYNHMLYKEYCL